MKDNGISLKDLFLDCLADIYYAEQQLVNALPKMAKAARDEGLKTAFESHLQQTEGHVRRVEEVFELMGAKPKAKKCPAIAGLLAEADEMAARNKGQPTLDAALIAAAQKVEHYEIATYGTLFEWAAELEQGHAARVLKGILAEEHGANDALTELAESCCNINAQVAGGRETMLRAIPL